MYVETLAGFLNMAYFFEHFQCFQRNILLILQQKPTGKTEFDILGFLYRQVIKNAFILQNNGCLDFHFRNIHSSVETQASKRTYVSFHLACPLATGSVAK